MTDFMGIFWGAIDRIILFPAFLIFAILLIRNYGIIKRTILNLVHPNNQKKLLPHYSKRKAFIKLASMLGALLSLFIAILQPQWDKKEQIIKQEGRDLLIVLDISKSMLAQDLKPNRLEFIKLKIRSLLDKLTCERVGLILFSGSAFVQCPLTVDYAALLMFLDQVDTETISSGTTAIDEALEKTIELYKEYPGRKNRLVLLATDGEDFSSNLSLVQQQAKKENLQIFALGVGSVDGAPIPRINEHGQQAGYEQETDGSVALSKLNEKLLQEICTSIGGTYLQATYDDYDLDSIVAKINSFEKDKFSDKSLSLYEDQYPWFLAISWACLALEWII